MTHTCPRSGCTRTVSHDKLLCPQDWHPLPKSIKAAVWRAWDNGNGEGTPAHRAAIAAAIRVANNQHAGNPS